MGANDPVETIEIRGRGVVPGTVEGEALVCPEGITGWGGIDPSTGIINEYDNPHRGKFPQWSTLLPSRTRAG